MNKRYQVFISSTYADLKEERAKVIQAIMELDCIPAGMEIFPAIDEEQFTFIKRVIDDCDYYLLIIGGRYGTLSDDGISYTEKEYDYAISKGIKVIAFIHSNPDEIPFGKSEKNAELRKKLDLFKQKVSTNRLVKSWCNLEELTGLVALSLSKTIKTYPAIGWVRANEIADPELYKRLSELQRINQELKDSISNPSNNQPEFTEELASLDDTIELKGTHTRWDNYLKKDVNTEWKIKITWNLLFSTISPYLLNHPNDSKAKSIFSKAIYDLTEEAISRGTATLNDQDYQTIKLHLKAIDLIEIRFLKTKEGGMALFWNLTDKGEKLMIELRSIKK